MVGRADDPAEDRADQFAATVMAAMSASPPPAAGEVNAGGQRLQRSAIGSTLTRQVASRGSNRIRRRFNQADPLGGTAIDQSTATRIRRASGGVALPDTVRRAAEHAAGRDLGGVRVHSGSAASDLNDRVQASAFTLGRNIFLGSDAARPGSESGNRLLAHEIGHVVEEGGGATIGRIQRRADLRPLEAGGAPTVRRLFGSGKKKEQKEQERQAALTASIQASAEHEAEKHPHFAPLQSAVARVEGIVAKLHSDQSKLAAAGPRIIALSRQISDAFEGAEGDPGFGPLKRRLRVAADDVQILLDRVSVADAKRQAGNTYMNEGRQGNLKALTPAMQSQEFVGDAAGDKALAAGRQAAGEALGLSKAEQTAITVFTAKDYTYINPATANDRSWMLATRGNKGGVHADGGGPKKTNTRVASQFEDAYMANRSEEGSLHAGLAVQGLVRMKIFKGLTYRGESFTEAAFKKKFKVGLMGRVTARDTTITRTSLVSASKEKSVAVDFIQQSAGHLRLGADARTHSYCLLWEFDLTDGRDIEALSMSPDEKEVATLPGAKFKIISITPMSVAGHPILSGYKNIWSVKAVQVK